MKKMIFLLVCSLFVGGVTADAKSHPRLDTTNEQTRMVSMAAMQKELDDKALVNLLRAVSLGAIRTEAAVRAEMPKASDKQVEQAVAKDMDAKLHGKTAAEIVALFPPPKR